MFSAIPAVMSLATGGGHGQAKSQLVPIIWGE